MPVTSTVAEARLRTGRDHEHDVDQMRAVVGDDVALGDRRLRMAALAPSFDEAALGRKDRAGARHRTLGKRPLVETERLFLIARQRPGRHALDADLSELEERAGIDGDGDRHRIAEASCPAASPPRVRPAIVIATMPP